MVLPLLVCLKAPVLFYTTANSSLVTPLLDRLHIAEVMRSEYSEEREEINTASKAETEAKADRTLMIEINCNQFSIQMKGKRE